MPASLRIATPLLLAALTVSAAAPAVAQAPADLRQGVAYVDVMPSGIEAASAAFVRYRSEIAKEGGFVAVDVFEQIGRRGHFVVVDTWRDQAAYDAHQGAGALSRLMEALQPIRTTGYDRRPYKALAVGPALQDGRNAIAIVTHVDIGGGAKVDVPGLLRDLAEASRKDPGCLRFDVTQHTARANHFTVVEVWESERALDAHAAAAHTRQFRDTVQPISGSPIDERVYRRVR